MRPDSHCRSCGAPVRWVITAANGRPMPIDPSPVTDGNVWIDHIEAGKAIVNVVLSGEDVPANVPLRYVSHFVTCPDAPAWRKRR